MPLKLNVGLSRKVGEANYGSRGASVNLEIELDSAIAGEPQRLQERIRQLFGLAKQSIDAELHAPAESSVPPNNTSANNQSRHATGPNNGQRQSANGNGRRSSGPPPATESQVRALNAIANRQNLRLGDLVRNQFGVNDAAALTVAEASQLIDELNANNATAAGGGRQ